MTDTKLTLIVSLDDESKALLKAAGAGVSKGATTTKPKGKTPPPEDDTTGDDDMNFDDATGEGEGDEGDGEGEADETPDVSEVSQALATYAKAPGGSKALAVKLLKTVGKSEQLSKVKAELYADVITAAAAATAKLKKAAK